MVRGDTTPPCQDSQTRMLRVTQCANGHELSTGQAYCHVCGAAAGQPAAQPLATPASASGQTQVRVQVQTASTPGTGALWLSIFGFCGITAILGIILGFTAISQAKRIGAPTTKGGNRSSFGVCLVRPISFRPGDRWFIECDSIFGRF